jgi:hypothetical protein
MCKFECIQISPLVRRLVSKAVRINGCKLIRRVAGRS